jgi:hypothetical protein
MNRQLMTIVSLLVLASVLSAACAAPAPTPPPKVVEKPVEKVATVVVSKVVVTTAPTAAPAAPAPSKVSMKECYVSDQILLTGHATDIDATVKTVKGGLTPLKEFKLDYFAKLAPGPESKQNPPLLPSFPYDKYDDLVIQLYKVTSGDSTQIVEGINNSRSSGGKNVYADLNYLIGYPVQGLTWITEGSPAGPQPITATEEAYKKQWAFDQIGLSKKVLEPTKKGQDVLVGVFDAFPEKGSPSPYVTLDSPQPSIDVSDHGPFVEGLLKSVAPNSTVWEYRVLNEYGQGTLDALIGGLGHFLSNMANKKANLKGAVINLSLEVGAICSPTPQDTLTVYSLGNLLVGAYRSNVVIVAASGNDSNWRASSDLSARLPARWGDFVIGVGASNQEGERACFSNKGNVLAPGGEGDGGCKPAVKQCTNNNGMCKWGVVSNGKNSSSYYFWAGTSFATPLVSGLAALVLGEKGDIFNQVYTTTGSYMTPTVNRAIACNDQWGSIGNRVISVPGTLSANCLKPIGVMPLSLSFSSGRYVGKPANPLPGTPQPEVVISGVSAPPGMVLSYVVSNNQHVDVRTNASDMGRVLNNFDGMVITGTWTVTPVGSVPAAGSTPPEIWISWKAP